MTKFQNSMLIVSAAAASLMSVQAHASTASAAATTAAQTRITVSTNAEGEEIFVNGRSVTFCTREELRGSYSTRKSCLSRERSQQLLRR